MIACQWLGWHLNHASLDYWENFEINNIFNDNKAVCDKVITVKKTKMHISERKGRRMIIRAKKEHSFSIKLDEN